MTMHSTDRSRIFSVATRCLLAAVASSSVLAGPALAQTTLHPQQQRITDEAIQADLEGYQALQDRIKALNDSGNHPVRSYHLAKAQCWLDVSFHEYSRNDRSAFPQAALSESEKLVAGMERGTELGDETPLVNGAARVREDLWKRLGAQHGTPGFTCSQAAVACGEVELVHAGNEYNQQQWRHAKPYIEIAEDATNDAEALARQCGAVDVAAAVTPLTANVLFDFDRDQRGDIRAYSLASLDAALARIKAEGLVLRRVELVGHADRLQGRGFDYNQQLSSRRALTVQALLVAKGVPESIIASSYVGDTEQVNSCEGVKPGAALRECLVPNRRVEVKFVVERAAPTS